MTTLINGIDDLKSRVGQHLGYTNYREITQDMVQQFADVTDDHSWIHVDVEQAKTGPFGGTIAHGYLTLSLAPSMMAEVTIEGISMGVNYGANKVRFPAPLPIPSRLRMGVGVKEIEEISGGVQAIFEFTFEAEGSTKPACVAECVFQSFQVDVTGHPRTNASCARHHRLVGDTTAAVIRRAPSMFRRESAEVGTGRQLATMAVAVLPKSLMKLPLGLDDRPRTRRKFRTSECDELRINGRGSINDRITDRR